MGEAAPVSDTKLSVPRLSPADRVVWRDIQDVKKDVCLDALPAHITPFADFMKVMADKAGVGAPSPRDVIKEPKTRKEQHDSLRFRQQLP